MSETKKIRVMSVRGFLHKASGRVSADAFLKTHREFLLSGDLAQVTSPIIARLDAGEILPTPGLIEVQSAVLSHMIAIESAKAEDAILNPKEKAPSKNWIVTIFDAEGNICTRLNEEGKEVELKMGFDLGQRASEWADRRLFAGASDWYATVTHTSMVTKEGEPISSIIMRQDAIARILKSPKGPAMKSQAKAGGTLGNKMKVSNFVAIFSKG